MPNLILKQHSMHFNSNEVQQQQTHFNSNDVKGSNNNNINLNNETISSSTKLQVKYMHETNENQSALIANSGSRRSILSEVEDLIFLTGTIF